MVSYGYLSSKSPIWTDKYWVFASSCWMNGFQSQCTDAQGKVGNRSQDTRISLLFPPGSVFEAPCSSANEWAFLSLSFLKYNNKKVRAKSLHTVVSALKCYGSDMLCRQDLISVILFETRLEYLLVSHLLEGSVYASKLKRRREPIIEQNLGKGDSFDLNCLHQYPSHGDGSTPHLTM